LRRFRLAGDPRARRSLAIAAILSIAAACVVFLRSTPDAWPYGDAAVIQIYTLQALRGFLKVGPYSQYGWHHPGPLYFYLLVPPYLAAGQRAIGLAFGALAINVASLTAITWMLTRHMPRLCAGVVVAALALCLWRAGDLAASIWNPHIVVFPMAALVVACAAVAMGDRVAVLVATLWASFLMQTHVSTVPCCLVIVALAAVLCVTNARRESKEIRRALGTWATISLVVAIALWLPTMLDELTGHPGNLSRLWRFFIGESRTVQPWRESISAWAEMLTLSVRPGLQVPWGAPYVPRPPAAAFVAAGAQLTLIAAAAARAHRAGNRFVSVLCGFELLASVVAYWSIARIPAGSMGDYQIFWIAILGGLTWGTLAALAITWGMRRSTDGARSRTGSLLMILGSAIVLWTGARALAEARAYAVAQTRIDVTRKILSRDVLGYIDRERIRRPLFHIAQSNWVDATCIVLEVYKRHREVAVEERWVVVFGEALAVNGREDVELRVVGPAEHATLSARPGDRVIAGHNDVFVHALARK
jgi:hypothetical protein